MTTAAFSSSPSAQSKRAPIDRATYSLAEFAPILGVSYDTAWEAAHAGTLPVAPIRIGKRFLFPRAKVHAVLGIPDDRLLATEEDNAARER